MNSKESYLPFVPLHLLSQLNNRPDITEGHHSVAPFSETVYGTVLFADISGFTKLSTELSSEQLKIHINNYFGRLIKVVHSHHGDCIKFCGDAVMILWSVGMMRSAHVNTDVELETDLPNASHAIEDRKVAKAATAFCAALCALELIVECGEYLVHIDSISGGGGESCVNGEDEVEKRSAEGWSATDTCKLSLHCGIASGVIHCLCLGGCEGGTDKTFSTGDPELKSDPTTIGADAESSARWEYLLSGRVLKEVGVALDYAASGEVCLSPAANALVCECFESCPVMTASADMGEEDTGGEISSAPVCFKLSGNMTPTSMEMNRSVGGETLQKQEFSTASNENKPFMSVTSASASGRRSDDCCYSTTTDTRDKAGCEMCTAVSGTSTAIRLREELHIDQLIADYHSCLDIDVKTANSNVNGAPVATSRTRLSRMDPGSTDISDSPARRTSAEALMSYISRQHFSSASSICGSGNSSSPQHAFSRGYNKLVAALSPVKRGSASTCAAHQCPSLGEIDTIEVLDAHDGSADRYSCGSPCSPVTRHMFTIRRSSTATPTILNPDVSVGATTGLHASTLAPGRRLTQINNFVLMPPSQPQTQHQPVLQVSTDVISFKRRGTQMNGDEALLGIDVTAYGVDSESDDDGGAASIVCVSPCPHANTSVSCNRCPSSPVSPMSVAVDSHHRSLGLRPSFYGLESSRDRAGSMNTVAMAPSAVAVATTSSIVDVHEDPAVMELVHPLLSVSAVKLWRWKPPCTNNSISKLNCSFTTPYPSLQMSYKDSTAIETVIRSKMTNRRILSSVLNASRHFVHEAAVRAIGNNCLSYVGEIRQIVTAFIGLENLQEDFNDGLLARPQQALCCVTSAVRRFGGSLRQFVVDDKGCVAILSFGTPGACHENNIPRAIRCCLAIQTALKKIVDVPSRIGISQGIAYCGLVGSDARCEYAMMGACVNLAARIMCACPLGDVLVDEPIYRGRGRVDGILESSEDSAGGDEDDEVDKERKEFISIHCKGYSKPVKVHSVAPATSSRGMARQGTNQPEISEVGSVLAVNVTSPLDDDTPSSDRVVTRQHHIGLLDEEEVGGSRCSPFVGREAELKALSIGPVIDSGPGSGCSMLLVEGAAKTGKSSLLWELVRQGRCINSLRVVHIVLQSGSHSDTDTDTPLVKHCVLQLITLKLLMLHECNVASATLAYSKFAANSMDRLKELPEWLLQLRDLVGKPAFVRAINHMSLFKQSWLLEFALSCLINAEQLFDVLQSSVDNSCGCTDTSHGTGVAYGDVSGHGTSRSEKTDDSGNESGSRGRSASVRVSTAAVRGRIRLSTRTEAACVTMTMTGTCCNAASTKSDDASLPPMFVPSVPIVQTPGRTSIGSQSARGNDSTRDPTGRFNATRLSSKSAYLETGHCCEGCGEKVSGCCCVDSRTNSSGAGTLFSRRSTISDVPMHAPVQQYSRDNYKKKCAASALLSVVEARTWERPTVPDNQNWLGLRSLVQGIFAFRKPHVQKMQRRSTCTDTTGIRSHSSYLGHSFIGHGCDHVGSTSNSINNCSDAINCYEQQTSKHSAVCRRQEQLVLSYICDALLIQRPNDELGAGTINDRNSHRGTDTKQKVLVLLLDMLCQVSPAPYFSADWETNRGSAAAIRSSVCLMVDDVHHCDRETIDILVGLKNRLNEMNIKNQKTQAVDVIIAGFAVPLGGTQSQVMTLTDADITAVTSGGTWDSQLRFSDITRLKCRQLERVKLWRSSCGPGISACAGASPPSTITLKPFVLAEVTSLLELFLARFNRHLRLRCERLIAGECPNPRPSYIAFVRSVEVQISLIGAVALETHHPSYIANVSAGVIDRSASLGFAADNPVSESKMDNSLSTGALDSHAISCCALSKLILEKSCGTPSYVQFYCRWVVDQLEGHSAAALEILRRESIAASLSAALPVRMLASTLSGPPTQRGADDVYTMTSASCTLTGNALTTELTDENVMPSPPVSSNNAVVGSVAPLISIDISNLPRGPEDLLLGNFDKLSGRHQFILKAASVIGTSFDMMLLHKILQQQSLTMSSGASSVFSYASMQAGIRELEMLEWIVRVEAMAPDACTKSTSASAAVRYRFCDEKSQEVVHKLMLNAQKVLIHSFVASQYESQYNHLSQMLCPALSPAPCAIEFPQHDRCLVDKLQVVMSKMLFHFEMSKNMSKLHHYLVLALTYERWVFPSLIRADVLDSATTNSSVFRQDFNSAELYLSHADDRVSTLGSVLALLPGTSAAHHSRLARILSAVSHTTPACSDFGVNAAQALCHRRSNPCWWPSRVCGRSLFRMHQSFSDGLAADTNKSICVNRSSSPKRTHVQLVDVLPAIWWLQSASQVDNGADKDKSSKCPKISRFFSCLSANTIAAVVTTATNTVTATGCDRNTDADKYDSLFNATKAIDAGDSEFNVCDVGYWVGELGLVALDHGDPVRGCLHLYQAHKMLLLSHSSVAFTQVTCPTTVCTNNAGKVDGVQSSIAAPVSASAPEEKILPFSSVYSFPYIRACYLLFYLQLAWHYATFAPLYNLELADSIVKFGTFALKRTRDELASDQQRKQKRCQQKEKQQQRGATYYVAVLTAMQLGFDSLALLIATLKVDSGASPTAAASAPGTVTAGAKTTAADTVTAPRTVEKGAGIYQQVDLPVDWSGPSLRPFCLHKRKPRKFVANNGNSKPGVMVTPSVSVSEAEREANAASDRLLGNLTKCVDRSHQAWMQVSGSIDQVESADHAPHLPEATPVFCARTAPSEHLLEQELARKLPHLSGASLRSRSPITKQAQVQALAQAQPTGAAQLPLPVVALSGIVYNSILRRVRHFCPMIRAFSLTKLATRRLSNQTIAAITTIHSKPIGSEAGIGAKASGTYKRCRDSILVHLQRSEIMICSSNNNAAIRRALTATEGFIETIIAEAATSLSAYGSSKRVSMLATEALSSELLLVAVLAGQSDAVASLIDNCIFTLREYCEEERQCAHTARVGVHTEVKESQNQLQYTVDCLLCETTVHYTSSVFDTNAKSVVGGEAVERYQSHWLAYLQQLDVFTRLLEIIQSRCGESRVSCCHSSEQLFADLEPVEFTDSYGFGCRFNQYPWQCDGHTDAGDHCIKDPRNTTITTRASKSVRALHFLNAVLLRTPEPSDSHYGGNGSNDDCDDKGDSDTESGSDGSDTDESLPCQAVITELLILCCDYLTIDAQLYSNTSSKTSDGWFLNSIGFFSALFTLNLLSDKVKHWINHLELSPTLPGFQHAYQLPHPFTEGTAMLIKMQNVFKQGCSAFEARAAECPLSVASATTSAAMPAQSTTPVMRFQTDKARPVYKILYALLRQNKIERPKKSRTKICK